MIIKIERFWDEKIQNIIGDINDSLKRMEIDSVQNKISTLFNLLKGDYDSKTRVSLLFVLEKIAQFEPFFNNIINFIVELLEDEQDSHVKEFAVYILGNLALERPNLALITRTLPIFIKFCEDSSELVRTSAEDIKNRLNHVKETKIKEREVIQDLLNDLIEVIDKKLEDMNNRASKISRDALNLDYEAAHDNQEKIVEIIHKFTDLNEKSEGDIKSFIKKQVEENPVYEGEFEEAFSRWKNMRAEKEDLIRQVHCILRIQGKIYKIIQYIKSRGNQEDFSIQDLKNQTEGGLRGIWSNEEIIETLEKLVDEEIIPNLFLQQLKDLKGFMDLKKDKK